MKNDQEVIMENEERKTDALTELGADLTKSRQGSIYTLTIIGQSAA